MPCSGLLKLLPCAAVKAMPWSYLMPWEDHVCCDLMQGRILTFSVKDAKLRLVSEKEVKGAVYNVNPFQVAAPLQHSTALHY